MKKEIADAGNFERETSMCRKLNLQNGGKCNWGKCENCGVIPMLYKLYKGELLEDVVKIKEAKAAIFTDQNIVIPRQS